MPAPGMRIVGGKCWERRQGCGEAAKAVQVCISGLQGSAGQWHDPAALPAAPLGSHPCCARHRPSCLGVHPGPCALFCPLQAWSTMTLMFTPSSTSSRQPWPKRIAGTLTTCWRWRPPSRAGRRGRRSSGPAMEPAATLENLVSAPRRRRYRLPGAAALAEGAAPRGQAHAALLQLESAAPSGIPLRTPSPSATPSSWSTPLPSVPLAVVMLAAPGWHMVTTSWNSTSNERYSLLAG